MNKKTAKAPAPKPTPVYTTRKNTSRSFVSVHTGKFTFKEPNVLKLAKKMYLTAYPHGNAHIPPYSEMFGGFLVIADALIHGEISYE